MYTKRGIMWFRQDLRLHDNEALTEAISSTDEVLPVYIFDERAFGGTTEHFGFPKIGPYRARFIIESVAALRAALQAVGSNLIVRVGRPEEVLFELAQKIKSNWVFCNRERTPQEIYVQDTLEQNLWSIGQELRYARGKMLYYTADLPFPITHTPDTFSQFKKEVERYVPVREPLAAPEKMAPIMMRIGAGELPSLADFGLSEFEPDSRAALHFQGGEAAGLERLRYYVWESGVLEQYTETRDELNGTALTTKLSAWLAQGCLSPKRLYYELQAYEAQYGKTDAVPAIFQALLWRDFLRLMVKKHGATVFERGGLSEDPDGSLKNDECLLRKWTEGNTGLPFIDANMREIKHTGYMSNRGRQNVASFLVKDLQLNWQMGAEYFESILIDYDVTSNWANWNYAAGLSRDAREDKHFNIISQALRYDPKGDYVKKWLPELSGLPAEKIHQPDLLSLDEQRIWHLRIGSDYPEAMISTERWRAR